MEKSYQVLMRKLRPMRFDEVIGQKHIIETLKNSIKSGRFAHAYLFSGTRGVGKTTVARLLAKALSCENLKDGEPCNQCESCKSINNSSMVDVQEIDGASNTGVDSIRTIRENIIYPPINGKYKIYIIDEVHMLSTSAFNALLKTLEEPPEHGIFILATTETHKVPQTIISRCQHFDFKKISVVDIQKSILSISKREDFSIKEDAALLIAREARGSIRDSLSILEQVISFSQSKIEKQDVLDILGAIDRTVINSILDYIVNGKTEEVLKEIEQIYKGGYDLERVAGYLVEALRDSIIIALDSKNISFLNTSEEELRALTEITKKTTIEDLENWFQMAVKLLEDTNKSSIPELVFEMGIVSMSRKPKFTNISKIIKAINNNENPELEKKNSEIEQNKQNFIKKTNIDQILSKEKEAPAKLKNQAPTIKNKVSLEIKKPTEATPPNFYKQQKESKLSKVENSELIKTIDTELKEIIVNKKVILQ